MNLQARPVRRGGGQIAEQSKSSFRLVYLDQEVMGSNPAAINIDGKGNSPFSPLNTTIHFTVNYYIDTCHRRFSFALEELSCITLS